MTTSLQRRPGVQGQRVHSPVSPTPQYDPYGPQLGYLSESIHRLLTERECSIFDRGLADYHRRRNIRSFVECLSLVLNTNQKRQLLLPIRDSYVKPSDLVKFNQLVQDLGLATSLKRKKKEDEKKSKAGVRRVEVKRNSTGEWGFSIRGGSEHGVGVFVSWVEPGSGAQKSGLQIGDQILKANDLSFENISHYDAVLLLKSSKKVSLWVLSRGRVPSSRMTHKVYRWMSPEGRSVSPPPDPFDVQDQANIADRNVMNEADERKVTLMVDAGQELGISIRGGAEHGLGIYISVVEEDSVAENYGLKAGDQILEVNGISFHNIVHADAANSLKAQPCMVMKIKDVGKLPHSRITTYGQTEWKSPQGTMNKSQNRSQNVPPSPVFKSGMGTQVMHGKQQTGSIQGRGLMNEVARSVLNTQELETFNYYVNQYDQHGLSVDDLVIPLLELLDTPEKLQLLSEMRALIKARDLQRFNELTVHKEISAKQASSRPNKGTGTPDGSSKPTSPTEMNHTPNAHDTSDDFIMSPFTSPNGGVQTPHDDTSEDGGRDKVPQKLPSQRPEAKGLFHIPPPPSTRPATSTPDGHSSPDPHSALANTLKERRQWMRAGTKEQSMDETWEGQWNETSLMSSIHQPPAESGHEETVSGDLSAIEAKVRSETEAQLRQEFEEQQRRMVEEQQQRLAQEKQEKERTLRRERENFERELKEKEKRMKAEIEEHLRIEAEERIQKELEERERALASEYSKKSHEDQLEQSDFEEQVRQIEERTRMELEEKIWKEAEDHMRQEFEAKMEEEKTKLQSEVSKAKSSSQSANRETEKRLRRELEEKFKREYDEKMRNERAELKKQQHQDKKQREEEEKAKREYEVARLEAEEQARIEAEEKIRKEAEATARAEYEARLQKETEERAKLAEEVKARRQAEERMEREREREREKSRRSKPPAKQQYEEPEAAEESEEDLPDNEPMHTGPASEEDQRMLDSQRRRREAEEREQRRREEEERRTANEARIRQEQERQNKLDLQRKREENIRRREEERKQKEAEAKQRREQQKNTPKRSENGFTAPSKPKTKEPTKKADTQKVKVKFGDGEQSQKTKQQLIEEERRRAEEKLQRRLKRSQEKKEAHDAVAVSEPTKANPPTPSSPAEGPGKSFGGYDDLHGDIRNITVTKIVKKLGIAIDGGANTKQKAVIIREISPEGCAAQTAPELKVGQQILSVAGESLFGKKHKEVVLTVKAGFEGPLNKTLELVVLDQH